MEPLIRQWQNRPCAGGWALEMEIKGQTFRFTGTPYNIVNGIIAIQKLNKVFRGEDLVWEYCNSVWRDRDPARAIRGEKEKHTIFEMAFSLAKAAVKAGTALVSGDKVLADKDKAASRIAICLKCEEFIEKSRRCGKCGCYLDYKKLLETETCPLNKW